MQIDGQCHCGAIKYRADVDPKGAYVCHCTDCQAISGGTFRWAVPVAEADFKLISGTPKTYVKTGASGQPNHQLFCGDCAAPLYAMTPMASPMVYRLRLGTARQRDKLVPKVQYWHGSGQPWACDLPGTRCLDGQ